MKTKSKVESPNDSTPLFNLPHSFIATGGEIDRLAVAAGYTSGLDWANSGNQWNATLAEAREMLMAPSRPEIEKPAPPQPVQAATREAHTPLPWRTEDGQIFGVNPEFDPKDPLTGEEILIVDAAPENSALTEYDEANCKFICRAVNSHAELLEALQSVINDYDDAGCDGCGVISALTHKKAVAAIAKAEGAPEVHELPTDEELSERTGLNVEDWVQEVSQGNTRRSYSDWLNENAESMKGGAS